MKPTPAADEPLSDGDLNRLDELLEALNPDGAMLLEEIDGFFASLACGPLPGPVDRYLTEVLGLEDDAEPAFESAAQQTEFTALLQRHLTSISQALAEGEGFAPILMHDDEGRPGGNLWAIGFLRGISVAADDWEAIEDNPELAALLEPFETLAEELDLETGDAVNPIPADDRQPLIDAMAEAAFEFHEFFSNERAQRVATPPTRGPRRRH